MWTSVSLDHSELIASGNPGASVYQQCQASLHARVSRSSEWPPVGGILRGEAVVRVNRKKGRKDDHAESLQVTLTQSLQTHTGYPTHPELIFRESVRCRCRTLNVGCLRAMVSYWCQADAWWGSAGSFADLPDKYAQTQ